MKIPEQVKRLALVIAVIVTGVLVTRFYVIPRSLVSTEFHRSSTVERELAKPVKFAGSETCQGCHEAEAVKKNKSFHRNLACEGCHGPAATHADDPTAVKHLESLSPKRPEPGQTGVHGLLQGERLTIEPAGFSDMHTRGAEQVHRLKADPHKWQPLGIGEGKNGDGEQPAQPKAIDGKVNDK